MKPENVLLIGGSGFLGNHLAHALAARGCNVRVPTRRRERAKELILLPTVDAVEADVHDPKQLGALMAGQDVVINLVGILHSPSGSPYGREFARAHVELPRAIVAACLQNGVGRLLHVSALGADRNGPSQYLRSKADGEAAIREGGHSLASTVFRPSVMFGVGDSFLSMFAALARLAPVLPLAGADARFQPVYVEDVVAAMVESIDREDSFGQTYELCGPRVYTLRELVSYAAATAGTPRSVVGLPGPLAYLQALSLELAPGKLMSRDNLASMSVDNVCSGCALPFGRTPTPLETVAPTYLGTHMPRARYYPFREKARR